MKIHKSITAAKLMAACSKDNDTGFCTECGTDMDNVEPDARRYRCGHCGEHAVYGAEELLFHI